MYSRFRTAFLLSFLLLLFVPLFFPWLHLLFFAPALVIALYKGTFFGALWRALVCGLCFDLFSSSTLFGLTSLNYAVTLLLLYKPKNHFFEDNLSTLPLMTFVFSVLSSALQFLFSLFVGMPSALTWKSAATDLLVMPLGDVLLALLLFSLPFHLHAKRMKRV